jgi:hypothetical protein
VRILGKGARGKIKDVLTVFGPSLSCRTHQSRRRFQQQALQSPPAAERTAPTVFGPQLYSERRPKTRQDENKDEGRPSEDKTRQANRRPREGKGKKDKDRNRDEKSEKYDKKTNEDKGWPSNESAVLMT